MYAHRDYHNCIYNKVQQAIRCCLREYTSPGLDGTSKRVLKHGLFLYSSQNTSDEFVGITRPAEIRHVTSQIIRRYMA